MNTNSHNQAEMLINTVSMPRIPRSPMPVDVAGIEVEAFLKGRIKLVSFSCVH